MDWERFNQLVVLSESGKREEAVSGLQELIDPRESPNDNASVLLIIGSCEKELGRFDEARKTLAEACSLAEKNGWIQPRALFFDASIDIGQGNWKRGLEKLDAIVRDFSPLLHQRDNQDLFEEVRRKRGMALYELGHPSEARPLLEAAASVEYERATALYYLGRCCYDLGHLERAKECLREVLALDLHPVYQPSAHYILGLAYHWKGQHAWAIREFEWCLQHDIDGRVAKWKVLTAIVNASKALNLENDVERYSKMLQGEERRGDAKART